MVKFAKYLSVHLVPEWRDAYCNYKKLKKDIKRVKNHRMSGSQALRPSHTLRRRYPQDDIQSFIKVNHKQQDYCGTSVDLVETELLVSGSQASNEVVFFAKLDQELNKVNDFYILKEAEFQKHAEILDMQMQTLFELKVAEEKTSTDILSLRWRQELDSDLTTPLATRPAFNRQRSIEVMDAVVLRHNEMLFKTITNHRGLNGIVEDPEEQLSEINDLEAHSSPQHILNATEADEEEARTFRKEPSIRSRKTYKMVIGALPQIRSEEHVRETSKTARTMMEEDDSPSIRARIRCSETMLRDAYIEFYRGLTLLKDYSTLNHLAFSKTLKKYDKATERDVSKVYMKAVDISYFATSNKVSFLLKWVESMFADFFMNGDRHQARNALKPRVSRTPHRITFFLGLFTGCSLALWVAYGAVLRVLSQSLTPDEQATRMEIYMRSVFPVFSMTALLLLHMYMYGINLYFWRRTRINYAFIFEFAPGTELNYRNILLVATGLTVVYGVGVVGHLTATLNHSPSTDFIPLGVLLTLVFILFFPLDYFYRSSRVFFLKSLFRLITAPSFRVRLADFFLGDQLCSQVPVLRNIEFAMCYYVGGWFLTADGDKCTSNKEFILGFYFISILPYWWRLMQCVRRYVEEKQNIHLANGFKYFSAMIAVVTKIFYGQEETMPWLISYVTASTFATIYQAYWDIVIDWGLLNRKSHNRWLRDQLILEDKNYVYYISMVFNVLFRLPWVLSITHFQFGGLDPHLTDFIFAAMEIVRRGHWNFYRLENEHLNNVGNYRATKTVPLPFEHKEMI